MKIEPMVHRCTVRSGPAEGNKNEEIISRWNWDSICSNCHSQLASIEDLILHIYEELTP